MRPRVSDESLRGLLTQGDPAPEKASVTVTPAEREAFLSQLTELPSTASPRRLRLSWMPASLFLLATASALVLWWPRPMHSQVSQIISTPVPIASTPVPIASTPAPIVSTPAPIAPTPAPIASTPALIASTPTPIASTPTPIVSTPAPIAYTPAPIAPTPVVTHVLISADSTCAPEKTTPPTERITILGDGTSVVAVTESLPSTTNEETKEVSL
jgi:hypothetical protein